MYTIRHAGLPRATIAQHILITNNIYIYIYTHDIYTTRHAGLPRANTAHTRPH